VADGIAGEQLARETSQLSKGTHSCTGSIEQETAKRRGPKVSRPVGDCAGPLECLGGRAKPRKAGHLPVMSLFVLRGSASRAHVRASNNGGDGETAFQLCECDAPGRQMRQPARAGESVSTSIAFTTTAQTRAPHVLELAQATPTTSPPRLPDRIARWPPTLSARTDTLRPA
jgi:hypothetical protein